MNSPWRCDISPRLSRPGDAEPGDVVTFCAVMDDTFIENSYVQSRQSHVAICEAACILGGSATFDGAPNGRVGQAPFIVVTAMAAFIYALSARLLDGHFDRLESRVDSWFTDELRAIVTEAVGRLHALRDRLYTSDDVAGIEEFYASQVPRVFLSVDSMTKTYAELKPWATYALSSIILACPRLHTWAALAIVPPCLMSAYTCMSTTVSSRLFSGNEVVASAGQTVVSGRLTRRQDRPESLYVEPAAAMFLFIYDRVLRSAAISVDNDCTPLLARWMIWHHASLQPVLRAYLRTEFVRIESPLHGLPTATRLANLIEFARFYSITRAVDYAINPVVREMWGAQISAVLAHIKPVFPMSVSMLLTCSPVPLPSLTPASGTAMPDLSLIGIRARMVRIGAGEIRAKFVNRHTGEGSTDAAEVQWIRTTQPTPGDCEMVALYNTDVDYTKEAVNLVHCLRLQGAAYAGHTEWCKPGHVVQSLRRVMIDGGALRVFMLMALRTTARRVARSHVRTSRVIGFSFFTPIVYREMCALPHIQSPALRAEVASALCSLITTMIVPTIATMPWSAVVSPANRLGFKMTLENAPPGASTAELLLAGPFHVLLHRVIPWIADKIHAAPELRDTYAGLLAFAWALLSLDASSVTRFRLPRELWLRVLRVFFVADRYIANGRENELPTSMTSNPGAVQALSFMYIHAIISHADIVEAYAQSESAPQHEPDLMDVGLPPPAAAQVKRAVAPPRGKQAMACRAAYVMRSAAHRSAMCLENFVADQHGLDALGGELEAVAKSTATESSSNLYDVSAHIKAAPRLVRRAAVASFVSGTRSADLGTAINELRDNKRPDPVRAPKKRARRKRSGSDAAAPEDEEEDATEDGADNDYNDDDDDDGDDDGTNESGHNAPVADAVANMATFAFCALLMACTEDAATYIPVAAKLVAKCSAGVGMYRSLRPAGTNSENTGVASYIADTMTTVCNNRDKQPLPGMYRPEWFPEPNTAEALTGDIVLRSLFLLEVTPVTTVVNGFTFYRTLGNRLPAAHRFRDYAGYDLPYGDAVRSSESGATVVHYAYSLTHGVRDGHVSGVSEPLLAPLGVAPATLVPYRMSSARWASQMHICDSPVDTASGQAAAELASAFL